MKGLESRSPGAEEYRRQLLAVGLFISNEYQDEGQNHFYDAFKKSRSDLQRDYSCEVGIATGIS
jgi:hypothetical protein